MALEELKPEEKQSIDNEIASLTLQEKQAKAKALIEELKEKAVPEGGGKDAQEYEIYRHKMSEALYIQEKVKAEKVEHEKAQLVSLIEEFDKALASHDSEEADAVTSAKSRLSEIEARQIEKASQGQTYGHLGGKQKVVIKTNDTTMQMFRALNPQTFEKALVEGTGTAGGYLVVPEYLQTMFAAVRGQGNALRRFGWLNVNTTTSNQIIIPRGGGATTVGWTAELATKPSSDQTFSQLQFNVYTLAGLAYASLQMIADGDPSVTDIAVKDLALRLANAEEKAIIDGTGSGQPLGILRTSGVNDRSAQITALTGQNLIDGILDCVLDVQTNYFAPPTGILMHPKRLSYLFKTKDGQNNYIFNQSGTFRTPGGAFVDGNGFGVTSQTQGTVGGLPDLFGLPIGTTVNMPTNKGTGTNQDYIIVGNFDEALWFQRQDVTLDTTREGAGTFETNQLAVRLEERGAFTAGRFPSAFSILSGTAMV